VNLDVVLKQLNALRSSGSAGVSPANAPAQSAAPRSIASPLSAQTVAAEANAGTQPNAPTAAAAAPASPAVLAETPASTAGLEELWVRLLEAVGRVSPFTRTYLVDAYPAAFSDNVLTIGFDPEFEDQLGLVDNARNHTLLQTKLAELGHPNAQIKFVKAEAPAGRVTATAPTAASRPPAPTAVPKRAETGATVSEPKPAASPAKEKSVSVPFNKDDFKNDPLIQKALEIFKGQIVEVRA
jgi:hypothetical protein